MVSCTSSRLVLSAASSDWATLCAVSPTLEATRARVLRSVSTAMASPTSTSTRATSAMAVSVTWRATERLLAREAAMQCVSWRLKAQSRLSPVCGHSTSRGLLHLFTHSLTQSCVPQRHRCVSHGLRNWHCPSRGRRASTAPQRRRRGKAQSDSADIPSHPAQALRGARCGPVFAADPAAVAQRVDGVEEKGVVQLAPVGLVAPGHTGNLNMRHPARGHVLVQLGGHVSLHDLAVVDVHQHLEVGGDRKSVV